LFVRLVLSNNLYKAPTYTSKSVMFGKTISNSHPKKRLNTVEDSTTTAF